MTETLAILGFALSAAASFHLLLRYENHAAAVAWLFGFWVFPFVGVVLYVLFAARRAPRSVRKKRERARSLRHRPVAGSRRRSRAADPGWPDGLDAKLHRLSERLAPFPMSEGNAVDLFASNDEAFDAMLEAIASAEFEVGLGTYILRDDRLGRALRDALVERASSGVAVRLVYDQIGSVSLPRAYLETLRRAGAQAAGFLTPSLLKRRFQINFRNHRKILVVDGRVAFTGGLNWGDEYSESRSAAGTACRDLHVRVRGPVVADVRRVFLEDWCLATEEPLPAGIAAPAPAGDTAVRVVAQGPDEERDHLVSLLAGAIVGANERVLLCTPYFVPGHDMRGALRLAALRGDRVTLLVPARSDSMIVDLAARRHFEDLLDAGVDIRLYRSGMLHAKAMSIDGAWSTVGSANYDQRSFRYNYELNLEILGPSFAGRLAERLQPWLDDAERLDDRTHRLRPAWRRVLENASNLFEPLL